MKKRDFNEDSGIESQIEAMNEKNRDHRRRVWFEILFAGRPEKLRCSFVFCEKLLGYFCDDDLLSFLLSVY